MQTKIYFASSVPAAFDVARQELGADALFVRSVPDAQSTSAISGRFEVTFGWDSAPAPAASRRSEIKAIDHQLQSRRKLVEAGFSRGHGGGDRLRCRLRLRRSGHRCCR